MGGGGEKSERRIIWEEEGRKKKKESRAKEEKEEEDRSVNHFPAPHASVPCAAETYLHQCTSRPFSSSLISSSLHSMLGPPSPLTPFLLIACLSGLCCLQERCLAHTCVGRVPTILLYSIVIIIYYILHILYYTI